MITEIVLIAAGLWAVYSVLTLWFSETSVHSYRNCF